MEFIVVIGAGLIGYVFGAIWYGVLGRQWQAAVGLGADDVKPANSIGAYICALIANIVIAGMMRHIFATSGIYGVGLGAISGLGLGLFIAGSYLMLNYSFAKRPMSLRVIDIGHAAGSATVMGAFLGAML
jgi:hypothetical protein